MMLPECRNVIDLLNDGPTSSEDGTAEIRRAHADLVRAKQILMQYSQYEVASTIDLLECDLCCSTGDFEKALVCLYRYEYHSYKKTIATTATRTSRRSRTILQFEKARLLVASGKFHEALSEYEDLLERMETEVQERMEKKKMDDGRRSDTYSSNDDHDDILPVIDAVSAVTGVGITKLLLHLRSSSLVSSNNGGDDADEIIESLDTATEMLLESRKDALLSPIHYQLAVDLGLAASISLTNAGVAHCLLVCRAQHDDNVHQNHHRRAMELWKEGLATLDMILVDAANSLVVIPRHKFICMESVRARLYCNISCTLLGLYSSECPPKKLSNEILNEASDAAKKALDIYDELMNGSKFLRNGGSAVNDGGGSAAVDDGPSSSSEWEDILKEQAQATDDGANPKPTELPLASIGMTYHKCESARALGLLARCYAHAGSAVTAEGLFQSAMDASSSHPFGRKIRSTSGGDSITHDDDDNERIIEKGVSVSSSNLTLIARDVRLWKSMLYDDWDKRERDADRLRGDALLIENDCALKGYVRDKEGMKQFVSGLEASLYLISPSNFK